MKETTWFKDLMEMAKHNAYYQQCLTEVRELEPVFLNIRSSLPELQQKALDSYISACEELDHSLLRLAWNVARDRGVDDYLEGRKRHAALMKEIREHGPLYRAASEKPEQVERMRRFMIAQLEE